MTIDRDIEPAIIFSVMPSLIDALLEYDCRLLSHRVIVKSFIKVKTLFKCVLAPCVLYAGFQALVQYETRQNASSAMGALHVCHL